MFLGEYTYSIDEKKRLAIPSKFRTEAGETVVVTKGLDSCLFVFPQKEWQGLAERLGAMSLRNRDERGFSRLMLAGAMESTLDKMGRIIVPEYLKEYAGLDKQVVIAGVFNRIEILEY